MASCKVETALSRLLAAEADGGKVIGRLPRGRLQVLLGCVCRQASGLAHHQCGAAQDLFPRSGCLSGLPSPGPGCTSSSGRCRRRRTPKWMPLRYVFLPVFHEFFSLNSSHFSLTSDLICPQAGHAGYGLHPEPASPRHPPPGTHNGALVGGHLSRCTRPTVPPLVLYRTVLVLLPQAFFRTAAGLSCVSVW